MSAAVAHVIHRITNPLPLIVAAAGAPFHQIKEKFPR
jgi:hypothetical protein